MKDVFGVEVRVGDTILASANSFSMKIGKVYGFGKAGNPLITYQYRNDMWSQNTKGPCGTTFIVLNHEGGTWTDTFWNAVFPEGDSDGQS